MQNYYYNKISQQFNSNMKSKEENNNLNKYYFCKTTIFDKLNLHLFLNDEKCVLLYGFGGLGKTQLALEYGSYLTNVSKLHLIKYFETDSSDQIISNYIEFFFNQFNLNLNSLKSHDIELCLGLINEKLAKFYETNFFQFLFIFDNIKNDINTLTLLKKILNSLPFNVKILCISKSSNKNFLDQFDYKIEIKPWDRNESRIFLTNSLENIFNYQEINDVLDFFKDEFYIPLELQVLVDIINNGYQDIKTSENYLIERVKDNIHHKISIYLFQELFFISQVDRYILLNIGFLGSGEIDDKFIKRLVKVGPENLEKSLNRLENYSIIKRSQANNFFSINKCIHIKLKYFIRKNLTKGELESFFNQNVITFLNILNNDHATKYSLVNENNLLHIRNFLEEFESGDDENIDQLIKMKCIEKDKIKNLEKEAILKELIGDIFKEKYSEYGISIKYYKKALVVYSKIDDKNVNKAILLNKIAILLQIKEEYKSSISHLTTAVEIIQNSQKDKKSDHFDSNLNQAIILNNIGLCYQDLEDFDTSYQYFLKSHEILKHLTKNIDEKQIDEKLSIILNNIGANYRFLGDYQNAAQYLNFALENKKIHYNIKEHLSIANTLNNVGLCYLDTKQYDISLAFFIKSSEIYEKLIENKLNQTFIDLLNNIGLNYYYLNDYEKSIEYFDECLTLLEQFDKEDKNKNYRLFKNADLFTNKANSYFEMFKYDKSIEFFEMAINIYEKINTEKSKMRLKNLSNKIGLSFFYTNQFGRAFQFLNK